MIDKKERSYFTLLIFVFSSLILFAIVSLGYLFVKIGEEESLMNNVFELIYLGLHIVMMVMGIILSNEAKRRGSNVMRSLTYSRYGRVSMPARIISIAFILLGIALFTYALLLLFPIGLYDFSFPIALKWDMLNVGVSVAIIAFFFFLFPFLFPNKVTKTQ